jgi:proliferating cell nuclear antigen
MNIQLTSPVKAETFATIFQHMKLFTDNINIMFESERMFIQGMDSARVSIFEITLPATWFDEYEHEDQGTILIGISSSLLFRVLNTRDKSQNLIIKFDQENSDKLLVDFVGESKVAFDKHFELPLMNIDEEMMAIPEIDYQAEFSLSSSNYSNMINQMKMFGDCLEIKCSEERIDLLSNSVDLGKMSVNIPIEDLTEFSINEGETLDISFSLNYMHMFCMYSKLSKDVNLSIRDNYPMKMLYKLGEEGAQMTFYLAPKLGKD